jgi:hypothetical protein
MCVRRAAPHLLDRLSGHTKLLINIPLYALSNGCEFGFGPAVLQRSEMNGVTCANKFYFYLAIFTAQLQMAKQ